MLSKEMQEIIAIPLKFGSSTKPLRTSAHAQLIAKALFISTVPLSLDDVKQKTEELISRSISIEHIKRGLEYLREDKKASFNSGKWTLLEKSKKEIETSRNLFRKLQKQTLNRLFPKNIKPSVLEKWFDEASIMFFSHFGDEWVESVCKNSKQSFPKVKKIEELLKPSIDKYILQNHSSFLVDGFLQFLLSDNEEDHLLMMNLGYAMFSARLVACDIGADPITFSELLNSKFILDTNFLISIALDKGKMSDTMRALGRALLAIKAKLVVLHETREEYGRVITGKKNEVINLFHQFPLEILKDINDDFIATAIKLGCKDEEDFNRFFKSLQLPELLPDGPSIIIEDDAEIKKIAENAKNNEKVKGEIRNISQLRPEWRQKSEAAISHDASLLEVGRLLRDRDVKTWILSFDSVIQACSFNQPAPNGLPLVITADTLIHLLALNDSGPDLKSTDFAPLLSQIILRKCIPPVSSYNILDLHVLHSINERVSELPAEKIKDILRIITLARLEGKSANNEKLQQIVNRAFQEKKLELPKELQEEKERRIGAEKNAANEKREREKIEHILIKRNADRIILYAWLKFSVGVICSAITASVVAWWVYIAAQGLTSITIVDKTGLISFVILFFPIKSLWEELQNERRSAYKVAKEDFCDADKSEE